MASGNHQSINSKGGIHKTTQGASIKLTENEIVKLINNSKSEFLAKFDNEEDMGPMNHVVEAMATSRSVRALYFLSKQNKQCLNKLRDIVKGKLAKRKPKQLLSITLVCPKDPSPTNKPFIEVKLLD